jgi:formamidopyrimidine-DNA glycosylase
VPELPDIVVYIEALEKRVRGTILERVRVASPFLLRTAVPPLSSVEGRKVIELRRLGKRICFGFEDDLWLVLHLMIAGRVHWYDDRAKAAKARRLAAFEFSSGVLTLTEAGTQKRASLHVVQGEAGLQSLNPGGLEIFEATEAEFAAALQAKNHTLKRALTDPRLISGVGNAYSDEILHRARLSPVTLTSRLSSEESARLFAAAREVLAEWLVRLRDKAHGEFPSKVTAFHDEMAVHGRFGKPCPVCKTKVQRIRYAENETNYCPRCQTNGRLLADRSLSRLLKKDWPKSIDELEQMRS